MFKFKKIMALAISFLLLLSTFTVMTYSAYGDAGDESTPRIVVQSVSGNPGETVDVKISFENNPGITSAKLLVSFPDDLTLTSVSFGDIGGQSLSSEKLVSPATLNWFNGISDLQTTEFVYATLTFKISNNATLTSNEISIDYNPNDLFNVNEVNVNFTKVNGSIVVFCDHTNTTLRNVLSPTCTQQGYSGDTYCLVCGKKMADGEVISALGHDYQDVVTPPTCTAQGYTTHTCSRCSDSYVDTYTEPTGHNYGEWTVTTSPTCTEPGVETRVCSNDNKHIEMREIPALGHTGGKATCTNKAICERCSQEYGELDPNYHPNAKMVGYVAPTCTEPGQTGVFTCPDCLVTLTESEEIPALGHSFTVYASDNNATCTADGTKTAKCERCDATDTIIVVDSKLGHNYIEAITAPTCTEQGFTTHTCSRCADSYVDTYTEPLGHIFVKYVSDNNATCTADGTKTAKCERCDATDTVVDLDSKLGHDYIEAITAPTCTEQGFTTHTCSRCQDIYVDNYTQPTGHSFTNYFGNNDATCTKDGTKTAKCDNCDATDTVTDVGSKQAHKPSDWKVVKAAAIGVAGSKQKVCTVCNAVLETAKIDALPYPTYTITYKLDGGKNASGNPKTYKYNAADITLKNPTKKGYKFEGWYIGSKKVTKIAKGTNKNITLTAKWSKVTYKITYKLAGGKKVKNPTKYTVTTSTIKLKNPTKKGYKFKGWYNGSKKVTEIKKGSTGDITLTAKWTVITYKITYKLGSGKNNAKNPKSYKVTTSTIKLKDPTKKGYTFKGWYNGSKKVTQIKKGSTGSITLTAKWKKK